ncbi:hypothetical protein [Tunturiibacter lichenicola]|uniref:hypothetical protein n=1 Tax=Tunturiibacter lichenicola TaxID=2051959 RepID=UPI003D9BA1F7
MDIEINPPDPDGPEEGIIGKQDVIQHVKIVEKADNVLRDPDGTSEQQMNDGLD